MDPIANPFRPGAGTQPPELVGRDSLLESFRITLERAKRSLPGQSVMPTGLRGVGKTVLLNRFSRMARDIHYSVGFIEAPETDDFRGQLAIAMQKVLLDLRDRQVSEKLRHALGVLKSFSVTLPGDIKLSLDVDAAIGRGDTGDLANDLTELAIAAGEAAREVKRGVLIAIDEVQYLSSPDFAAIITAIHRTTQEDLPVILVGAGLPQLPALAGDAKSYAERLFEFPEIGALADEDARAALSEPAKRLGVAFERPALDLILSKSGRYPYFIQEFGAGVWNSASRNPITATDVLNAEGGITARLEQNFFRVRFDRLTAREREYVHALARLGPGEHRSNAIALELNVSMEALGSIRQRLIEKGMLYSPEFGVTAFTVPLFDRFVRTVEDRGRPAHEPRPADA